MINDKFAADFFAPGIKYYAKELNAVINLMGKSALLESHAQWMELRASLKNIVDTLNKQLGVSND